MFTISVSNLFSAAFPLVAIPWALFLIGYTRHPQNLCNSFLLLFALLCTVFDIAGMFGKGMGIALLITFIAAVGATFLVPLLLVINGVHMIRTESFSLSHILSLLLGICIGIGEAGCIVGTLGLFGFIPIAKLSKFVLFAGASIFFFCVVMLCFVVYLLFMQYAPHKKNFDYIIIHGCGLLDGHRMSKLLSNRLDKALQLYEHSAVKPMLIPSGGQGSDEDISEAQAMKDYLLAHGVPEENILVEDRSATTMENLRNCKEIISSREGGKKTALVSSNYHIYRCIVYAKRLQMDCTGIGAPVAWYFWPSAVIREFAAVYAQKRCLLTVLVSYAVYAAAVLGVLIWF